MELLHVKLLSLERTYVCVSFREGDYWFRSGHGQLSPD